MLPKISHFSFAGAQEISFSLPSLKREFEGCTINHIKSLTERENKSQFHSFQYLTSLFRGLLMVVVAVMDIFCVENFLFHLESWIESRKFELFNVSQYGLLLISVVLVVELYILVWDFFYF